jgi:hypothetical protein
MAELSLAELLRVHEAAERFETAWRRGDRPRIEQFLDGLPPALRDEVLKTLIEIEIELRRGGRNPATRAEFERRFPGYLKIVAAVFREC